MLWLQHNDSDILLVLYMDLGRYYVGLQIWEGIYETWVLSLDCVLGRNYFIVAQRD